MTTLASTADGDQAVRTDGLAGVYALLFCAGVPAPIYQLAYLQLTWPQALSGSFGGGIESAAILAAAFMLALGVGSLAGGWLSKRFAIPLLPFMAAIELMTGGLGLASVQIFDSLGQAAGGVPPIVTAAALALVILSALPLGASVPLMVARLVRRRMRVGGAVGLIFCVIFAGAGAGCLLGLLLTFPFVFLLVALPAGTAGAVLVAVAINAAVAFGALAVHRRERAPTVAPADVPAALRPRKPMLELVPLMSVAAAGGFVALSYEIFFFRTLSYPIGSSPTAFAATGGAFLLGLAIGARQGGANCTALTRDGATRRAVGALMKANLLGLLFVPLIAHLAWLDRGIIAVAIPLVYLVARFWGALLPHLAELGIAADRHAGRRTAILGLANGLGAAAGAIFTGFVLAAQVGLVATGAALLAAGLVCALLLVGALAIPRWEKILRASLAATLGLLGMVATPRSNALERLQSIGAHQADPPGQAAQDRAR